MLDPISTITGVLTAFTTDLTNGMPTIVIVGVIAVVAIVIYVGVIFFHSSTHKGS